MNRLCDAMPPGALLRWYVIVGCLAVSLIALATTAMPVLAVFLAPLCHQIPDRCLLLAGNRIGLCARCLGFYTGTALGASAPALAQSRVFVLTLQLAQVVDFFFDLCPNEARFVLSLAASAVLANWLLQLDSTNSPAAN